MRFTIGLFSGFLIGASLTALATTSFLAVGIYKYVDEHSNVFINTEEDA